MTADENIRNNAVEPESYRIGLDAALKEAIQSFIDVRLVEEDDLEYVASEGIETPEAYGLYAPAATPQLKPQASAPVFARNMLTKTAPPEPKSSSRDGVLGSLGKAIGGLAKKGKHAKPSKEEFADDEPCLEEMEFFEAPAAIEDSYDFGAAYPAYGASTAKRSIYRDAEPAIAGASSYEGFNQAGLKQWLDAVDAPFSTTLLRLIDERGFDDVEVYKRAGMSRQLFSRIRSDAEYRPAKKTVLALAVALRLNADEARDLLERAGFALSHSDRRDLVVEYFLETGKHDLMAVNQALYEFDQPLL
ncbi:MAG: hypothetical protein IJJ32_00725 [Eggerthellaceae bacterium]|nr:hypothetical protein [Eggerthellaceae bacterium]